MPLSDNIVGLSGCAPADSFWTAGQMIDPCRESSFVWITSNTTMSRMIYTNWNPGAPDYYQQAEACMHIASYRSYRWNDLPCSTALCSVCELDITQ